MAVQEAPAPLAGQEPLAPALGGARRALLLEIGAYSALFVAAAALRFWALDNRGIAYDESLHTYFSYQLFSGKGYTPDPLSHGPLKYFGTALFFFLFNDSDFTARILPALFGSALVLLPLGLHSRLGRAGALATAALLAFSPFLVFYSRFNRDDIIVGFWTAALVVLLWRFLDSGRSLYLYMAAAALALSFATMEATFYTVLVLGAFALAMALNNRLVAPAPSAGGGVGLRESRPAALAIVLLTLSLPLAGALADSVTAPLGVTLATKEGAGITGWPNTESDLALGLAVGIVLALLLGGGLVGLLWGRGIWLGCAAVFWAIFGLFYTNFLTNLGGLASGVWRSLGYWLAQQPVERAGQPWYYYFVTVSMYEYLALILGLIAIVYFGIRHRFLAQALVFLIAAMGLFALWELLPLKSGVPIPVIALLVVLFAGLMVVGRRDDLFTTFMVFWALATFLVYSHAGEKMPWLTVHLVVPLCFLGGKLLGDLLPRVPWRELWNARVALAVGLSALAAWMLALLFWNAVHAPKEALEATLGIFIPLLVMLASLAGVASSVRRTGIRRVLAALAAVLLAGSALLSFRTAVQASFVHEDDAREMIIYAAGSGDDPRIAAAIERYAFESGKTADLVVSVDGDVYWGLIWYLRRYKTEFIRVADLKEPPRGDVLIMNAGDVGKVQAILSKYGPGQKFLYIWWPAEGYKGLTPGKFARLLVDPQAWGRGLSYFLFRKLERDVHRHEAMVFFAATGGPGPAVSGATEPGR
ncbi:MAG: TIGR03663 family protein [Chloroflexi bacterium]|nr:TIGR03663 family protein [Chloroflexota bacterium]